jgi:uncharacterized protein (TIGR03435 family)
MIPESLSPVANHLWQSTLLAGVAGLLTLALRKNRAGVRYWLWMTASVKFLIPLALLMALGSRVGWRTASDAAFQPGFPAVMDAISQPFAAPAAPASVRSTAPAANPTIPILLGIWGCGFLAVGYRWWLRWRRVRSAMRAGRPLDLELGVPIVSSPALMEPGVFGILRPVLLLPEGILTRLTPAQFEAILAHELCHVRRRDNLAATVHMLVEAIFWFHPLVWWLRTRLMEERERACDEEVLRLGSEPRVYAAGILKVCEFYLESPVACVAGVTGANLKRRIEAIVKNRAGQNLNLGRKLLLAAAALAAVAVPLMVGMMNVPAILRAQSPAAFEVASVKPHNPEDRQLGLPRFLPGGRLTAVGVPLQIDIAVAYNLPFQGTQLSGGPEWIRSMEGLYDIEAKAGEAALKGLSAKERGEKMRLMFQALLVERFKLVVRRETKEQPVYVLTVAKNGPRLQKSKVEEKDCEDPASQCHWGGAGQGRGIHMKASNMADLVISLGNFTDRPLIDQTGLSGLYDIDTEGWVPMRGRPAPPPGTEPSAESIALADPTRPTLFMILDKLGLKMEGSKAPVDLFVIDHVERPSGN